MVLPLELAESASTSRNGSDSCCHTIEMDLQGGCTAGLLHEQMLVMVLVSPIRVENFTLAGSVV